MSAALAQASASFTFHGAAVSLSCSSPEELLKALQTFGIAAAANDAPAPTTGKAKPAATPAPAAAATAPAGAPASATEASSAPSAAAPAAGEAGNAAAAAGQPAAAAPASSPKPDAAPEVTFEQVKKAFLALATKPDGRAKCEAVNKAFGVAKLSDIKPENHAAALAEIEKVGA